ncbi:MAG TPA: helix-turn-helix domain-containing protein [Roseococcus sp.]|nr:helix-turn-helix domain-containing protein [Roseococcus sp.]
MFLRSLARIGLKLSQRSGACTSMATLGAFLRPTRCGTLVEAPLPLQSRGCANCAARDDSFCRGLSAAHMAELRQVTGHLTLQPGQQLVGQGEQAEHFFNLIEGHVRAFRLLEDGRRQITGFLERGDFIGLTRGATYEVGVEAITEVRLCRFSRRALLALMDDIRPLERALHDRTSNELVAAHDHMVLLGCKTARERVITFLLQRAGPGGTVVELPMTQTDVADYLGLRLETVSRTMHALLKEGLIERSEPHRIQILKPAMLREMAG